MLQLVKNSGPARVTTATRQADEREYNGRTALRLVRHSHCQTGKERRAAPRIGWHVVNCSGIC